MNNNYSTKVKIRETPIYRFFKDIYDSIKYSKLKDSKRLFTKIFFSTSCDVLIPKKGSIVNFFMSTSIKVLFCRFSILSH